MKITTPLGATIQTLPAPEHLGTGVLLQVGMDDPTDQRLSEVYLDGPTIQAVARLLAESTTTAAPPAIFMQWKGTDVCFDFQCTCSDPDDAYDFHLDGFVFGRFRCPRCGTTYTLGDPPVTVETPEETARWADPATDLDGEH